MDLATVHRYYTVRYTVLFAPYLVPVLYLVLIPGTEQILTQRRELTKAKII
jgi:hypothetical protein